MFSADRHITLTELLKRVRTTLDEAFALPQWVSAEISEIKHHGSGHCYLELVEKGDDGMPGHRRGPSSGAAPIPAWQAISRRRRDSNSSRG